MTKLERNIVEQPSEVDIRAALARVISGPCLTRSPQFASFLSFVVETSPIGNSHRIKGYTIATDALGRDASFDPQNDPIVRVEAVRLRRALEHYYANTGYNDPIVIEMPSGGYVPTFRVNSARAPAVAFMLGLRRQVADRLGENYRQVLLIAGIAAAVSLTVEMLEHAVW